MGHLDELAIQKSLPLRSPGADERVFKPSTSLQRKLLLNSVAILAAAQLGLLAAMFWIITSLSVRHRLDTVSEIRSDLLEKGGTLVSNNARALQQMAADNSYLSVADLVATTVHNDSDMVYGIYMDAGRQPWVMADSSNRGGRVKEARILDDSISLWANGIKEESYRTLVKDGKEIFEFAAPIFVEGDRGGTIRYGLSMDRMNESITRAALHSRQALFRTIGSVFSVGLLAVLLAFLATRRLAERLTKPIRGLQSAANAIARGEYHLVVELEGEDEIALLAADFDSMRRKVKDYTERLHEMVDEKVREIRDILDNIGQGLFTVSYDGTVNPDYASTTNKVLGVDDVSRCTLRDLFRLDDAGLKDWMAWLELTRSMREAMSWKKLVRLSPMNELHLEDGKGGRRFVQIVYQPMYDGHGLPSKLMVLVQDVTESRRTEGLIRKEKERHEDEVKAILGIVKNAAVMPEFLLDVEAKLKGLLRSCKGWNEGEPQEEGMPALLRDLHTMKGTAATYGFAGLERAARQAELVAVHILPPSASSPGEISKLLSILEGEMRSAFAHVNNLALRLTGMGADQAVPVPERKIRGLRAMAEEIGLRESSVTLQLLDGLLAACRSLDHVRLAVMGDRYRSMLAKLGGRLGKKIDFRIRPESMEISPKSVAVLDEPLVHLLRNAADHGLEGSRERTEAGKPEAGVIEIGLEYVRGALVVKVEDDGRGIDIAKVVAKALAMGAVKPERLPAMTEKEKAALIFAPGLSTGERNDDISGMGVGMDAVAAWVESLGGSLDLSSRPGRGTCVEIRLPEGFETAVRKPLHRS